MRVDDPAHDEHGPGDVPQVPPMGTPLWWPYWSRRISHRDGDSTTFELEVFSWNMRARPGMDDDCWDSDTHTPRQGWRTWMAEVYTSISTTRPNPMRLPPILSDVAETMTNEYIRWWNRSGLPSHRVPCGRSDTPMPYHSDESQIIWTTLDSGGRRADPWQSRLSTAPLRLPSVDGPGREHPPKEGYEAVRDERRKTRHKTYGIKRATKWILARYEISASR